MKYLGYISLVILHISSINSVPDPVPNPTPNPTLVSTLAQTTIIDSHHSKFLKPIWIHYFLDYYYIYIPYKHVLIWIHGSQDNPKFLKTSNP